MVEGGTLLRCYTSQRGIEGSNPSSSASRVAQLQPQTQDSGYDFPIIFLPGTGVKIQSVAQG